MFYHCSHFVFILHSAKIHFQNNPINGIEMLLWLCGQNKSTHILTIAAIYPRVDTRGGRGGHLIGGGVICGAQRNLTAGWVIRVRDKGAAGCNVGIGGTSVLKHVHIISFCSYDSYHYKLMFRNTKIVMIRITLWHYAVVHVYHIHVHNILFLFECPLIFICLWLINNLIN